MIDIICYCFIFLSFVIMAIVVLLSTKASSKIIKQYGKPLAYFATQKCWKTVPVRGTSVRMYIYPGFIIVSDNGKDYFLDKSFKDFKLYGSILIKIFEVKVSEIKTLQINVTWKQDRMLREFFGVDD